MPASPAPHHDYPACPAGHAPSTLGDVDTEPTRPPQVAVTVTRVIERHISETQQATVLVDAVDAPPNSGWVEEAAKVERWVTYDSEDLAPPRVTGLEASVRPLG